VTGWNFSKSSIEKTGERIYNLERMLAVRDGISRRDDDLPPRLLTEAMSRGPCRGILLGRKNLERMLDEYYEARGWGQEGVPGEGKLEELGIKKLIK
jgi:aldehyde:ferredoxin oxidoreductase